MDRNDSILDELKNFLKSSDFYLEDVKGENIDKEDIEKIRNTDILVIRFANIDKLDKILKLLHNKNINLSGKNIVIQFDKETYITADQCNKLFDIRNKVRSIGADLKVDDGGFRELEDVLFANQQIDKVVNQINSSTIKENGQVRPLNEIEKFLWAYKFVANRRYSESEDNLEISRRITSILNTGDIVCVGFAKLLKEICNRLGIECYINKCEVFVKEDNEIYMHQNNIVVINNTPYYCDACLDCIDQYNENTFNYCLIPVGDSKKLKEFEIRNSTAVFTEINEDKEQILNTLEEVSQKEYISFMDYIMIDVIVKYKNLVPEYKSNNDKHKNSIVDDIFDKNYKEEATYYLQSILEIIDSKRKEMPLTLEEFEKALTNVYKASGYNEQKAQQKVNEIIEINIDLAGDIFELSAQNCFSQEYHKGLEV